MTRRRARRRAQIQRLTLSSAAFIHPSSFYPAANISPDQIPPESKHMNTSRSLFATAFKDTNQRPAFGIKKSIPFLNYWVPASAATSTPSTESSIRGRYQRRHLQRQNSDRAYSTTSAETEKPRSNMASATSFYDFKPLDSKQLPSTVASSSNPTELPIPRHVYP